jgi:chromosome partitioning protein
MKTLLIANPKGGAGKTTVATNLACGLAAQGERVFLWDLDRQKSALAWLDLRPTHLPLIERLDSVKQKVANAWLVLDSPAGLHGNRLTELVEQAHKIIVPVVPSLFDMAATKPFLEELATQRTVRKGKAFIAVIGMRVDARTKAAEKLDDFLEPIELPVLTHLRETQNYVNAAFEGKSIFDLPPHLAERDHEQWRPLIEWVQA